MTGKVLTVTPAYGRDYQNEASAIAAWNAGKDFIAETINGNPVHGTYVSIRDVNIPASMNITEVRIRYRGKTQVAILEM